MRPKYEFGQKLRVTRNVRNDGTFPGRDVGELLLRRGATGFVRDIGSFLQDEIIYSIDFIEYGYRVGCREQELILAEEEWIPNRYEFRDKVTLSRPLSSAGELVASCGAEGEIQKVVRDLPGGIHYHVYVAGRVFLVPEESLEGESDFDERLKKSVEKGLDASAETHGATLPWQSL